jgi:hypothetical protein
MPVTEAGQFSDEDVTQMHCEEWSRFPQTNKECDVSSDKKQ